MNRVSVAAERPLTRPLLTVVAAALLLLGALLAAVFAGGPAAGAQDNATPEAGTEIDIGTDDGTPAAGADEVNEADAVAARIERATAAIAAAQTDLDAVAVRIDAQAAIDLLAQATGLRDRAHTAADGADVDEAARLAVAATAVARAAGDLVEVQLVTAGLPSQEARASQVVAAAFEVIDAVAIDLGGSTDGDVTASLDVAQSLYRSAFDRYGEGAYAQAAGTARVAARLANVAAFLADPTADGFERGDGFGRDGDDRGNGDGRRGDNDGFGPGRDDDPDADTDEPVTVPEPTFDAVA